MNCLLYIILFSSLISHSLNFEFVKTVDEIFYNIKNLVYLIFYIEND